MTVYVQAATDTASLEEAIAGHKEKFDRDLAALQENYENSLARLRNTLIIINLGTLAAALLVACVLVHFGLRPLSRLSEAVSRVSEKDFRLSVRTDHMPVELRPVAGRLRQTLEMLRRAFDREKQAAADISHELRTPLAALMTTLEVGLRKERSAEEYREMLTECQEAGRQMSSLVERLLALARLDAGSDRLRARDVDVGKLADQCAGLVRPLATARGLSLSVNAGGKAMIRTDPDKLREVLNNLLHNAIEYNKPNGEISVAVHRDNGSLHLEVRDTGIGIPEDARENIFERFYRQDSSRHIETESMHAGIGLALVKGYVDLMGGRIHVDSTVGEGSTFHLDLPANQSDD